LHHFLNQHGYSFLGSCTRMFFNFLMSPPYGSKMKKLSLKTCVLDFVFSNSKIPSRMYFMDLEILFRMCKNAFFIFYSETYILQYKIKNTFQNIHYGIIILYFKMYIGEHKFYISKYTFLNTK